MSLNKLTLLLISLQVIALSCTKEVKTTRAKETAKILTLHNAQREFHFDKDSVAFVQQLSDNFISINKGIISQLSRAETQSRYHRYFSSVEFVKWEDISEPIIRFSYDFSLAYTIVEKLVVVQYMDEKGKLVEGQTYFAWTAIYNKYGDDWKIDCVTSTQVP